jgi:hypothetical protein
MGELSAGRELETAGQQTLWRIDGQGINKSGRL